MGVPAGVEPTTRSELTLPQASNASVVVTLRAGEPGSITCCVIRQGPVSTVYALVRDCADWPGAACVTTVEDGRPRQFVFVSFTKLLVVVVCQLEFANGEPGSRPSRCAAPACDCHSRRHRCSSRSPA